MQARNADLVEKAGLDPEVAPKTWDEFIENARTVQESGVAPYGLVFDNRDWRSLIPVTHSISTDVYTPDGLFMYDSEPAIQALEILGRMMELTIPDVLAPGEPSALILVDEAAFTGQQAAYSFKYQNSPLRYASQWPDPSKLMLSRLPAPEGGAGGTVFWDTGAVLFKYGKNKEQAVDFFTALSTDERIWQESVVGDPEEGILPVGSTAGLGVGMDGVGGESTRVDNGQSVDLGDLRESCRRQRNRTVDSRRQAVRQWRGRNGTSTSPGKSLTPRPRRPTR